MSKDNFNEWYKNSFEQLREEPPADVWENIQSELDVQEVWDRVDRRLTLFDRYAAARRWSYGIATTLLLTAGGLWLGGYFASESTLALKAQRHNYPAIIGNANRIASSGAALSANHTITAHTGAAPVTYRNKSFSAHQGAAVKSREEASWSVDAAGSMDSASENGMIASTNFSSEVKVPVLATMLLSENIKENHLASTFDHSLSPDSLIAAKMPGGFGIGAITTCNNTWIMNSTTYAGLKSKGLYRSRVSMAGAYGISASYELNPFWGIEANISDLTQRQVYSYFNRAGEYKEKANTLEYLQVTFLVKKKKPVIFKGNYGGATRTLAIGPTFRHLHAATDETNGSTKGSTYQYAKNDYGITFAYGYDVPLSRSIVLSPGIIAYGGIKDISRGREAEPSHFNRTHNFSIGANLTARYFFRQR